MAHDVNIATIAAKIGHPARAAMLDQLLATPVCTAGQLAQAAVVSRSVASQHLGILVEGGLVTVTAVGRHRWYRLASAEVADVLEALAALLRHTVRPLCVKSRKGRPCGPPGPAMITSRAGWAWSLPTPWCGTAW